MRILSTSVPPGGIPGERSPGNPPNCAGAFTPKTKEECGLGAILAQTQVLDWAPLLVMVCEPLHCIPPDGVRCSGLSESGGGGTNVAVGVGATVGVEVAEAVSVALGVD